MKIRPLTPETFPKALALLLQAFAPGKQEVQLVERLQQKERIRYEWVCLHRDTVTAYIAFTQAYNQGAVCGLHLGPMAVKPGMQGQGIGTELLRFCLRQEAISQSTLFVLGKPKFFEKFGFTPCSLPLCPPGTGQGQLLSLRNPATDRFVVGYEPEFKQKKIGSLPPHGLATRG